MLRWNLGLDNVAIHPDSGGTCRRQQDSSSIRLLRHSRGHREAKSRNLHPMFAQAPQRFCEIVLEFLAG